MYRAQQKHGEPTPDEELIVGKRSILGTDIGRRPSH